MAVRAERVGCDALPSRPVFVGLCTGLLAERDRDIVFTHADVRSASLPPRANEVGATFTDHFSRACVQDGGFSAKRDMSSRSGRRSTGRQGGGGLGGQHAV